MKRYSQISDSKNASRKTNLLEKWFSVLLIVILVLGFAFGAASNTNAYQDETQWKTYNSESLGLTFDYPANWDLKAVNENPSVGNYGFLLQLTSPLGERVEIGLLDYELSEDGNLKAWFDVYNGIMGLVGSGAPRQVSILKQDVVKGHQLMHVLISTDAEGFTESIYISHGNLVYVIIAYSEESSHVLEHIASTLHFSEGSPKTLNKLYNIQKHWPTLAEVYDSLAATFDQSIDIVERDRVASNNISTEPPHPLRPEFIEAERGYQKWLGQNSNGALFFGDHYTAMSPQGVPGSNRKALPSNWWSPIHVYSGQKSVGCASPKHTGRATYAIDIQGVGSTTATYAAQAGTVVYSGLATNGYGNLIIINTTTYVAGQSRTYTHAYAHLSHRDVSSGVSAYRGQQIGITGNTGDSEGAHLHFHARIGDDPVDLSPLVGFTPNMNYPMQGVCGSVISRTSSPIIIEPVMFTERYQPRQGHYWFCYTGENTTECHMDGVPNNGAGWDPLVSWQSPELRYNNVHVPSSGTYYIWVCGRGGTPNDDSLHMGYNGGAQTTSDRITGYHPNYWKWDSVTMDWGARPSLWMNSGEMTANIWMREDGMRIDRILMTKNWSYNPTGSIRCGGY